MPLTMHIPPTFKYLILILSMLSMPMTYSWWPFQKNAPIKPQKEAPKDPTEPLIRQILKNSGVENPEAIGIINSYKYAATEKEILVPSQELRITLLEKENVEKFKSDKNFIFWWQELRYTPGYYELYQDVIKKYQAMDVPAQDHLSTLKELCKEQDQHNYLNAKQALYHEGGHLAGKHLEKTKLFAQRIEKANNITDGGVIATALITAMRGACGKISPSPMKLLLLMSAGPLLFAKQEASTLAKHAFNRAQEWQADESIPNNAGLLHAAAKDYQKEHNEALERLRVDRYNKPKNKAIDLENTDPKDNLFSDHPTHLARARRFQERYEAVKAGKPVPPRQWPITSAITALLYKPRLAPEIIAF